MSDPGAVVGSGAVRDAWRRASFGEIVWRSPDGRPDAAAVIPAADGDVPCVALPYSRLDLARALDAAVEVAIGVTGLAGEGSAFVAHGRADVVEDPEGQAFHELGLLDQELAKHPASRRRLDSLLVRREHWWFLPRLLVRFRDLGGVRRVEPADALLAVAGRSLRVTSCHLGARDPLEVRAGPLPDPGGGPDAGSVPAVVLEHGSDQPELAWPWERRWLGTWGPDGFTGEVARGQGPLGRPMTLRERLRAERALQRGCRAGLREAGHA